MLDENSHHQFFLEIKLHCSVENLSLITHFINVITLNL